MFLGWTEGLLYDYISGWWPPPACYVPCDNPVINKKSTQCTANPFALSIVECFSIKACIRLPVRNNNGPCYNQL